MKNFNYIQPKSLKEASDILKKKPHEAMLYAGGTDALGLMKQDIIKPEEVVNLKSVPGLNYISYTNGKGLRIGALTELAEIAENPVISEKYPILRHAALAVASPQLRNLGTIAGNLCQRPRCWYYREEFNCLRKGGDMCYAFDGQNKYHCVIGGGPCFIVHPSDLAVVLLALDAKLTVFGDRKTRTVQLKDFFVSPGDDYQHENNLKAGEIITEIQIPELPQDAKSAFVKFRERGVWDFAVVSVGAVIRKEGSKVISGKLAFGGVAPIPWMDESLNAKLPGVALSEEPVAQLVSEILKKAEPLSKNAYKVPLVRNLTKRLLLEL
ncbi:MAG: xanthine dehydrogenase family protein subunit M [Ignavibacteria bacterium]|jgi:xanthine dehydrogenase YagS FAD-binding subunit|nr:xanthine dehydrogenase family protein subunit M [Ignavibacteria bacterium]MCU7503168.1 xanthine dehydrogenase family protein subunit M [Ignavibacteria bacterium]MCU7518046.1 xanthine dehydrogenase family protein subunit M [Ignavibacteria bacterium]